RSRAGRTSASRATTTGTVRPSAHGKANGAGAPGSRRRFPLRSSRKGRSAYRREAPRTRNANGPERAYAPARRGPIEEGRPERGSDVAPPRELPRPLGHQPLEISI